MSPSRFQPCFVVMVSGSQGGPNCRPASTANPSKGRPAAQFAAKDYRAVLAKSRVVCRQVRISFEFEETTRDCQRRSDLAAGGYLMHADRMLANSLSSIRGGAGWWQSARMRLVNVFVLLALCGCVPPPKKVSRTKVRHPHYQSVSQSPPRTIHQELSNAEKDKLFREFERWRAANTPSGLRSAQQDQSTREVGHAETPNK